MTHSNMKCHHRDHNFMCPICCFPQCSNNIKEEKLNICFNIFLAANVYPNSTSPFWTFPSKYTVTCIPKITFPPNKIPLTLSRTKYSFPPDLNMFFRCLFFSFLLILYPGWSFSRSWSYTSPALPWLQNIKHIKIIQYEKLHSYHVCYLPLIASSYLYFSVSFAI